MKIVPRLGFNIPPTGVMPQALSPPSGVRLWLDASDVSTITTGATLTWADKSGNAHHATQSVSASQPATGTRTLNGRNVLDFDGADDYMTLSNAVPAASNYTFFAVVVTDVFGSTPTPRHSVISGSNTGTFTYRLNDTGVPQLTSSGVGLLISGSPAVTATAPQILSATSGTSGSVVYVGGDASGLSSTATTFTSGINTIGGSGNTDIMNGVIGEILVYDRKLTIAEQNVAGNYLAQKWGITYTAIGLPDFTSVVGFGDSITFGQNASADANRWLNKFAAFYGASVLNKGIQGTVLQNSNLSGGSPGVNNGRDRYAADVLGSNKRDVIAILYGLNDLRYTGAPSTMNLANFTNDYQEIITGLLAGGYTNNQIVLASPSYLPTAGYSAGSTGFTGSNATIHQSYVDAVRALAVTNNIFYADVYKHMKDNGGDALIDTDYVHPVDAGHTAIFKAVLYAKKVV